LLKVVLIACYRK